MGLWGWCCCWDHGRMSVLPSTDTASLPTDPTGCEQTAPVPPVGHRQPLTVRPLPCFPSPFVCHCRACKSHCGGQRAVLGAGGPSGAGGIRMAMGMRRLPAASPAAAHLTLTLAVAPAWGCSYPCRGAEQGMDKPLDAGREPAGAGAESGPLLLPCSRPGVLLGRCWGGRSSPQP